MFLPLDRSKTKSFVIVFFAKVFGCFSKDEYVLAILAIYCILLSNLFEEIKKSLANLMEKK